MARTATGIDVGLRTAVAIKGQYKGNTFHVSGVRVATHAAGEDVESAWGELAGIKAVGTRIGLTGRDVNVRYTRVPEVPDWQLRNLMRFEVQEIGDQSGSEVASDFNLLPRPPEIEGEDVVLLAMARESLLERHLEGLQSIGGAFDSFAPNCLALYNAFLRYGVVQEETVLLANIGHDNIDVVISRGPDLLFARNMTGGGRLFDEAVAQRFGCSPEKAEQLKVELCTLRPGATYETPNHEKASRAVLAAGGQLMSLLQSAVMFCKSQVKVTGLKVDRVLLCGGGSALDGLPEYLSAGMGVPVEHFDPFHVVDASALGPEDADLLEEYKLEAVCALGLATMGSDPEAYSLELVPAAVAKRRRFLGGTIWLVAAAVVAVAVLGLRVQHLTSTLDEYEGENRGLDTALRRVKRVHEEAEALVAENQDLAVVVDELQGVAGLGEQVARTMELLDEHLPGDFWLTQMDSGWHQDPELRLGRGEERPVLMLRGRAREGVESPTSQHQSMIAALVDGLPGVTVNQTFDRGTFSVDLTLFAPPPEDDGEDGLEDA